MFSKEGLALFFSFLLPAFFWVMMLRKCSFFVGEIAQCCLRQMQNRCSVRAKMIECKVQILRCPSVDVRDFSAEIAGEH